MLISELVLHKFVKESVKSLVRMLAVRGPETDLETVKSIIARKEETLPHLIEMVTAEEYWDTESEYSVWTPICAMHILSKMGGNQALAAAEKALRIHHDDTEDWLTEDMPHVLAAFGPEGVDTLASIVADIHLDEYLRDGAARALVMISKNHPEIRAKSVEVLKQTISSDGNENARSLLIDALAEFKDLDVLPFITNVFRNGLIDTRYIRYDTILDIYAGKYDDSYHSVMRDPLDIFNPDPSNFYRSNNPSPGLSGHKAGKPKVGRNEPCPCGSGKKFKKCCLKVI